MAMMYKRLGITKVYKNIKYIKHHIHNTACFLTTNAFQRAFIYHIAPNNPKSFIKILSLRLITKLMNIVTFSCISHCTETQSPCIVSIQRTKGKRGSLLTPNSLPL